MNSMTGYGKADSKKNDLAISVEISSVNNRFLEYFLRLPKQFMFLEPKVKDLLASRLSRGKINLTVNYEDCGAGIDQFSVNKNLSDEIYKRLSDLKKRYHLAGEIEIGHLVGFTDIFKFEKVNNLEKKIWPVVKDAMDKALDEMIAMRAKEGAHLRKDMLSRLNILSRNIAKIEKLAPENLAVYRDKLTRRIKDVMDGKLVNGARIEEEISFLAERSDITEECVRFKSHLRQFKTDINQTGPVGKRLNFILQELNREANTIGSKTASSEISKIGFELKEEIEKIREQVQNIE
jgi:uncharacterized protein (TIGR00255 family)